MSWYGNYHIGQCLTETENITTILSTSCDISNYITWRVQDTLWRISKEYLNSKLVIISIIKKQLPLFKPYPIKSVVNRE